MAAAWVNRGELRFLLDDDANACLDLERACDLGLCERLELYQKGGRCLTGFGSNGVYYAAVSFVQLLGQEIPCCEILDWPDLSWRGQKIECRLNSDLMEKQDWMDLIDDLAQQKLNHLQIAIYGCWVVQYDGRVSEYLYVPLKGFPELKTPFQIKYFDQDRG